MLLQGLPEIKGEHDGHEIEVTKIQLIDHEPVSRSSSQPRTGRVRVFVFAKMTAETANEIATIKIERKILPQILREAGLNPRSKTLYSGVAGCKCGCSPGFIVTGAERRWDIYVNVNIYPRES